MSIYIQGLDLPQTISDETHIELAENIDGQRYARLVDNGHASEWCPIVIIKQHGRLIDADVLLDKDRYIYRSDGAVIGRQNYIRLEEVDSCPTVIERCDD